MTPLKRGTWRSNWWQLKYFPPVPQVIVLGEITENISQSTDISVDFVGSNSILETFNVISSSLLQFNNTITDTIDYTDSVSGVVRQLVKIVETLKLSSNVSDLVTFLNAVVEQLSLLDSVDYGTPETIQESLILSDVLSETVIFINGILESIIYSSIISESHINVVLLNSSISASDSSSNTSIMKSLLTESFVLSIGNITGGDTYIGYALSPETYSVTEYTNYNFTDSCNFRDEYFFTNETGLYKYGGSLDESTYIKSEIETAALSFGTSNLKQIPDIYLGLSNSNKLVLKVRTDGSSEVHYKLNKKTDNLQTQRIPIGKGLIGRYFQFEIITQDNTDFELSEIEFYPITLRRKL